MIYAKTNTKEYILSTFNSIANFCRCYNLQYNYAWKRINEGWSVEKILNSPQNSRQILDPIDHTEYKDFKTLCKHRGKNPDTIKYQMKSGWSLLDALNGIIVNQKSKGVKFKAYDSVSFCKKDSRGEEIYICINKGGCFTKTLAELQQE